MKILSVAFLVSLLLAVPAIAGEATDDAGTQVSAELSGHIGGGSVWDGPKDILWDNGPLVTSTGTGVGGADESIVDANETTNGFGCQFASDIRLSDDFTVPAGETWLVSSVTLFGYQTDSGTSSTIVGAYIEFFDNPPEYGTSVYGDLYTNVLTATSWMNCYRVQYSASGTNTQRPIMVNVCDYSSPISFTEGTYWICWQLDGTGASGPWNPPITINGQLVTGDAVQYYNSGWGYISDSTSGNAKGLPFILSGTSSGALQNETWAAIKTIF